MALHRPTRPFSVTCVTHDEAVLHCLNALAHFAEHVQGSGGEGSPIDVAELAWPDGWAREDGRITFQFSDPRRRGLFLGEATRLLAGKWTRIAVEDEAAQA